MTKKIFGAYHSFTLMLVGQRRELCHLRAFGTDGEQVLENALSSTFPAAQHVRCFLHFQDNLQRKLRELGLPSAVAMEIVKDVMGSPGQHQCGLVDAANEDQPDGMLSKFESRWNNLEEPYNSPPCFQAWFLKHCRDIVARYMLWSTRERAGLGSPPSPYLYQ